MRHLFTLNPEMNETLARQDAIRVAVVSDSHGKVHPYVREVVSSCDIVMHAGDICDAEVFTQLNPRQQIIYAVRGNNDTCHVWRDEQQDTLEQIPELLDIRLPGGHLVIEHGHRHGHHQPSHPSLRGSHQHARAIIYGHTHKRLIDKQDFPWIINPGASGYTRTHGGAGCAVIEATDLDWKIELFSSNEQPRWF
jgi:putative phosphoesterase